MVVIGLRVVGISIGSSVVWVVSGLFLLLKRLFILSNNFVELRIDVLNVVVVYFLQLILGLSALTSRTIDLVCSPLQVVNWIRVLETVGVVGVGLETVVFLGLQVCLLLSFLLESQFLNSDEVFSCIVGLFYSVLGYFLYLNFPKIFIERLAEFLYLVEVVS